MSISAKKDTEIDPFTQVAALKKMLDQTKPDVTIENRLRGSISLVEGGSGHSVSPEARILIRAKRYGLIDDNVAQHLMIQCALQTHKN